MPLVGFEPTIAENERPPTYALDRAATGTGTVNFSTYRMSSVTNVSSQFRHLCQCPLANHLAPKFDFANPLTIIISYFIMD